MEALSGAGEPCDITDSSDEMDALEERTQERTVSRKKKSKRHRGAELAVCWLTSPVCGDSSKLSLFPEGGGVENLGLDLSRGTGLNVLRSFSLLISLLTL